MIKKIISVLLSVVLVLGSMLTVFAEVESAHNIQITQDVYQLTINVETTKIGRLTAYIINTDNMDTNIYGIAQTKDYTQKEDKFVYQINMVMTPEMSSGTYKLLLGDVLHADKEFQYVSADDLLALYNSLDTANAGEIYGLLSDDNVKTSYDLTDYMALSDDIRDLVDEKIATWSLAATLDTLDSVENSFKTNMDEVMLLANLADAKKENFAVSMETAIKAEFLDDIFAEYVEPEAIRGFMFPEDVTSIAAEDVSVQYDQATLLAIADTVDYMVLYEATDYYADKGIVDVSAKLLKQVKDENLHYSLFKQMKEEEIDSIGDFEDTIQAIMNDLLSDAPSGNGGGSANGGGYGGASVGSTTRPVTVPKDDVVKPVTFTDLESASWATDAVAYLSSHGVVNGRGNNLFVPNDVVTREEFVKMIILAFDSSLSGAGCAFTDVEAGRWSYPYIVTASDLGLVTGFDDVTFNPVGGISREDLAVILYRAYKLTGKTSNKAGASFKDAGKIAGYAKDAVTSLVGLGVINGMGDGTFSPKTVVTRAQAAKAIYELLVVTGGVK